MNLLIFMFGTVLVNMASINRKKIEAFSAKVEYTGTTVEDVASVDPIESFMTPDSLISEFGADALQSLPFYDLDSEEYISTLAVGSGNTVKLEKEIHFILSKSGVVSNGVNILLDDPVSLERAGFVKNATTKIICHGFNSNFLEGPGYDLIPAYWKSTEMQTDPMNIILVDWSALAGIHRVNPLGSEPGKKMSRNRFYFPPARNTELVGNETARLINLLLQQSKVSLKKIHLIGHSLGAHAMGYAGKNLSHSVNEKISRITALDPAAPCFEAIRKVCFRGNYLPVSKHDAMFVDVIHTNTGVLGMKIPVGHADFYPNGGAHQPGCRWGKSSCSHRRSIELMAKSVDENLVSNRCPSWKIFDEEKCLSNETTLMGERCSTKANGVYYLKTL